MDTSSSNKSGDSLTAVVIIIIVIVILSCKYFIAYKIVTRVIYKRRQNHNRTTFSLPENVELKEVAERRQLQMVPVNVIVDLPSALSYDWELAPTQIYTNLPLDQIAYIKSYCHGSDPIGEGSFARVYKAAFQGKYLAIKEIEIRSPDIKIWVENEVKLLQGMEHINLNKLYAWCIEANISYLAYMHIDGCSLDDYLRGNCRGFSYIRKQSFRMIMGIAKGIEFLHMNKIIHVDIKPQNIMVDVKENEAKLVDFGFYRHVDWEGTHRSTDKIIGTKGYWAPEYCWLNKLSYKHDVYSFGIVVLEVITGQRHVDEARGSSQFHIPGYVRHVIENNHFEEAVDCRLKQNGWDIFAVGEALAVANIALRCAHPEKAGRPDMNDVVTELTSMVSSAHKYISFIEEKDEISIVMSR